MGKVLDAVRKRAALDNGILPNGEAVPLYDVPGILSQLAGEEIGKAAQSAPKEAWDIFRYGTDEEFAVLVNQIDGLGEAFEGDKALKEVMRLAKQRGAPIVLEETRAGFGALFGRFWDEAGTEAQPHKGRRATA